MEERESISKHKLDLACQLLDDVEMSRMPLENIVMKASRLARLVENEDVRQWLEYEMAGYDLNSAKTPYASLTGRLKDTVDLRGFWDPIASINTQIETNKTHLIQLTVPDISYSPSSANPNECVGAWSATNIPKITQPATDTLKRMQVLSDQVSQLSSIKSKVLSLIHRFVRDVYYQLSFSNIQESIFNETKSHIDGLLATHCGDVLEKIPSVYDRLAQNEAESISHALTTCRRMIDSFANIIISPTTDTIDSDGKILEVKNGKTKNRIEVFFRLHTKSESRRDRLRQRLDRLYDRVSAGVHDDVTTEEARFLFLDTYLLLGEVVSLRKTQ